jgi:hypothetical protein
MQVQCVTFIWINMWGGLGIRWKPKGGCHVKNFGNHWCRATPPLLAEILIKSSLGWAPWGWGGGKCVSGDILLLLYSHECCITITRGNERLHVEEMKLYINCIVNLWIILFFIIILCCYIALGGTPILLRHYATSWKVPGLIPDEIIGFFN